MNIQTQNTTLSLSLVGVRALAEMASTASKMDGSDMDIIMDPNNAVPYAAGKLAALGILAAGMDKSIFTDFIETQLSTREDIAEERLKASPLGRFAPSEIAELAISPYAGRVKTSTVVRIFAIIRDRTSGPIAAGMRDAAVHIRDMLNLDEPIAFED